MLLKVLAATLAALCKGAMPGLRGFVCGSSISSRSSGGVRNGSSGGRCSTIAVDDTEGNERNEGAYAFAATHSDDNAGSIVIVGATSP